MDLKKDFEEIKQSIDNENVNNNQAEQQADTEYIKAKAAAEVHETALIAQDPTKALNTKLNLKVAEHIDQSPEVANKISQTADKLVDKGLKAQENKATAQVISSEDETIKADFDKNKDEYLYHGIDHKIDAKWKHTMLLRINDVWFVIWAIILGKPNTHQILKNPPTTNIGIRKCKSFLFLITYISPNIRGIG